MGMFANANGVGRGAGGAAKGGAAAGKGAAAADGANGDPDDDFKKVLPQVLPLLLVQFCQATQVMMLFPMLVFMVDFYGIAGDDTRSLGKYCGILAAMFPLSMFVSAFFWGWVSDKIGRKPVLLLGVFSVGVGSILLGFTTSYYVALTIRIVTGLFNAITSSLKCMLSEIAGKHQARGMSLFAVAWTTGTLVGPSVAGFLAMPCDQYESLLTCGEGSMLRRYPFMLSFGGFGLLTVASAVYCTFAVEESLKRTKGKLKRVLTFRYQFTDLAAKAEEGKHEHKQTGGRGGALSGRVQRILSMAKAKATGSGATAGAVKYSALEMSSASDGDFPGRAEEREGREGREDAGKDAQPPKEDANGFTDVRLHAVGADEECGLPDSNGTRAAGDEGYRDMHNGEYRGSGEEGEEEDTDLLLSGVPREKGKWFGLVEVQVAIFLYTSVALFFVAYEELFPLFASSKVGAGGLSLVSKDIGLLMSIGGGFTIPFNLFLYPKLVARFGTIRMVQIGSVSCLVITMAAPLLRFLNYDRKLLWAMAILQSVLVHTTGSCVFASTIVLVNKASPPEHLGVVNSYGQSLACLARVIGPASVGYLWTLCGKMQSQTLEVTVPFLFPATAALSLFLLTIYAPKKIDTYS